MATTIGTSPAGVVWNTYRKTDENFAAKIDQMTTRLAELWKKHGSRTATARKITATGMFRIVDLLDRMFETRANPFTVKATVISGPREAMNELAEALSDDVTDEDLEREVAGGSLKDLTEAQIAFGVRAARNSIDGAVKALRNAK